MMHVFSRCVNEGLVIGENISVTVLAIEDDRVRLGISSPSDTPPYWEHTLYLESADEALEELQMR